LDDLLLAPEVLVQRADADACALCDPVGRELRVPVLDEDPSRGLDHGVERGECPLLLRLSTVRIGHRPPRGRNPSPKRAAGPRERPYRNPGGTRGATSDRDDARTAGPADAGLAAADPGRPADLADPDVPRVRRHLAVPGRRGRVGGRV